MKRESKILLRWTTILAVLAVGGGCIIGETAAGPTATPQILVVTVTPDSQEPPPDSGPADTPALELTPTFTVEPVTMTAGQELSCVTGPQWMLYEWVAKIAEGETVTLLAKASEEWDEYYYVRMSDGTECWAFGGSSTKTGDPGLLPVREAPPLPEVAFTIDNQTGLDIKYVYIREQDAAAWGANRISANLHPGESISLTLTAGYYDVKIDDFTGGTLYEMHDRPIGGDEYYRYLAVNEKMEFFLQNNYVPDLCIFKVRRVGFDWETVHDAGDGPVSHGERATFLLVPARYDVELYYCSGPLAGSDNNLYFGPSTPGYNFP